MEQAKIDRINHLAHKAKTIGLTAEEERERTALRREYIDAVLGKPQSQLNHTNKVDKKGKKKKKKKKGENRHG